MTSTIQTKNHIELEGLLSGTKVYRNDGKKPFAYGFVKTRQPYKDEFGEPSHKTIRHPVKCFGEGLVKTIEALTNDKDIVKVTGYVDYTSYTNKEGVEHILAGVTVTQLEAFGTVEAG